MMAISHLLEDFSIDSVSAETAKLVSEDGLEDLRLSSFEQGYTAGWDDAIRAQSEDQNRITGALGRNLEDFSFTYQEALVQMMSAVEPVFRTLIDAVLPDAMMQTVGLTVVEQCCDLAKDQIEQPIRLFVPKGVGAAISPVLQENLPMKFEIVESADIATGQVSLKIGNSEREIDGDRLLSALRTSVDAFFFNTPQEPYYGKSG